MDLNPKRREVRPASGMMYDVKLYVRTAQLEDGRWVGSVNLQANQTEAIYRTPESYDNDGAAAAATRTHLLTRLKGLLLD